MVKYCKVCEKSMDLSTATGKLIYKCPICQTIEPGDPMDYKMPSNFHNIEENVQLWSNNIRNAPYDVCERKAKTCENCGRDYVTQLRLGKNEAIVFACKCGWNSVSGNPSTKEKETKTNSESVNTIEAGSNITNAKPNSNKPNNNDKALSADDKKSNSPGYKLPNQIEFITVNEYKFQNGKSNVKIAALDYDYSLVKPLAGQFPRNEDDFILLRKTIPEILNNLAKSYLIVIFSNQTARTETMIARIKKSIVKYNLPINYVFVAKNKEYSKPNPEMFNGMMKLLNIESIDKSASFFMGDNFNGSDEQFANNIGLSFKKPEDIFPLLNPEVKTNTGKLSVVITVGFPASGKSFISKKVFPGFECVSIDDLGTRPKALKALTNCLKNKKNVIFDATSGERKKRDGIAEIARNYDADIYILYMNMTYDRAKKQNEEREGKKKVPAIVYSKYAKNFEMPTADEGILIIYDF